VPDTAIIKNCAGMKGLHTLCSVPDQEASTGDAICVYLQLLFVRDSRAGKKMMNE